MKRGGNQFVSLKAGNPLLLKALNLGKTSEFATPFDAAVEGGKKALAPWGARSSHVTFFTLALSRSEPPPGKF